MHKQKTNFPDGLQFYEELASDYDEMTRFSTRLEKEKESWEKWTQRYRMESVLDAACGTGIHAIVLAQMGRHVVGADISPAMIESARHHAKENEVAIRWITASMQELDKKTSEKFDTILCLGNSLPHLLSNEDLDKTLSGFNHMLQPGGRLIIQILNYHKILREKNRVVAVNRHANREFVRFYDFLPDNIRFNVLSIDWSGEKPGHRLLSTQLHPYMIEELESALRRTGFGHPEVFGDMEFEPYEENRSNNLVLISGNK